ncbi:MAG: hypothetical protein M3R48_03490 [Candidatus Dormibacteraeota bacterium]|nr:hypothetical protein [Candidatus Dormibacteraeota bacterium]
MSSVSRRRQALVALVAAVAAVTTDVGYLQLIGSQGSAPGGRVVAFIAAYIGAIAVAAGVAAVLIIRRHATAAGTVLAGAATGSMALGVLGIFSIGLALLITAVFLGIAAAGTIPAHRRAADWLPQVGAGAAWLVVLAAGMTLANS